MCSTAGLCWDVGTPGAGTPLVPGCIPQQCCVRRLWVISGVFGGEIGSNASVLQIFGMQVMWY